MNDLRDRLLLPVGIPLAVLATIGVLVFSFSRILLAVQREVAIAIALAAAVDILVIAILIAGRKPGGQPLYIPMLGITAVAVIGGGMFAMTVEPPEHGGEEGHEGAAKVSLVAEGLKFDLDRIAFPTGGEVTIEFDNRDAGVPHNVAIYRDEAMTDPVHVGAIENGPKTITETFQAPPPGTYFFRCDVHPTTMTGSAEVTEAEAPAGGEEEHIAIEAKGLKFDKTELHLPADAEATIEFTNSDAGVPHNIAFYTDDTASEPVFVGPTFNGVATREHTFPATPSGSYFFRCDVHPTTMTGTAVVG